ncbi:MAG: type II toxin-antitoxin system PemK/MazF family toxin [Planctomycetes bacterium]|nr:type II toxin-antitoxin system PemK/MazF family toxin [Planctomycetota bacterium]
MAKRIFQGCIVRAEVRDPQGGNPKIRPLVIVTATEEITACDTVVGTAITSVFSEPLQVDEVALPWHASGFARTSLTKPCVAKCSWLCEIAKGRIIETKGSVLSAQMKEIIEKVKSL